MVVDEGIDIHIDTLIKKDFQREIFVYDNKENFAYRNWSYKLRSFISSWKRVTKKLSYFSKWNITKIKV